MTRVAPPAKLGRQALIDLARQVAAKFGKEHICRGDFVHATGIGDMRIKRHFKGWRELFEAAGVTPRYRDGRLADETLLKALSAAFLKEGRIATRTPAGKIGAHSVITYLLQACKRWGDWTNTLAAFHAWDARPTSSGRAPLPSARPPRGVLHGRGERHLRRPRAARGHGRPAPLRAVSEEPRLGALTPPVGCSRQAPDPGSRGRTRARPW